MKQHTTRCVCVFTQIEFLKHFSLDSTDVLHFNCLQHIITHYADEMSIIEVVSGYCRETVCKVL